MVGLTGNLARIHRIQFNILIRNAVPPDNKANGPITIGGRSNNFQGLLRINIIAGGEHLVTQ